MYSRSVLKQRVWMQEEQAGRMRLGKKSARQLLPGCSSGGCTTVLHLCAPGSSAWQTDLLYRVVCVHLLVSGLLWSMHWEGEFWDGLMSQTRLLHHSSTF